MLCLWGNNMTLETLFPQANKLILEELTNNYILEKYGVNTNLRLCHLFSQLAEESNGFRTLVEYGNKGYFHRYDGKLGNTIPGDGYKYRGRGYIQITGKTNYKKIGSELKINLLINPDLLENPEIALMASCEYWKDHNLNHYADKNDIVSITKRINGGLNGLKARENYLHKFKKFYGVK